MIQTTATVVAYKNGFATVEAQQKTQCHACSQHDCAGGTVSKALTTRTHTLTLPYPNHLPNGTLVILAIPKNSLLKAACLMFFLPMLCALLCAFLSDTFLQNKLGWHETITVLAAILGGGLGFRIAKIWHKKISQNIQLEPKIIKILSSSTPIKTMQINK